jgi:hypothetical protein
MSFVHLIVVFPLAAVKAFSMISIAHRSVAAGAPGTGGGG